MNLRHCALLQVVIAASLWSLSGFFAKPLTESTILNLNAPLLSCWQIAFYRASFAAIIFLPTLRGTSFRPRPLVFAMMACFATLNLLFMAAMTLGSAASAILLQYTAPAWILIFGAIFLKEWPRRRDIVVLLGGMCGIVMIVAGTSQEANRVALAAALGSGLAYAAVLLCLRALHDLPSQWLTVLNLSASGLVLLPVVMTESLPSGTQLVWLAVFGVVQFAIPYVLMARALRYVSPLEAGLITLLEPVLNPIWAYLISPQTETPPVATLMGGAIIIGTLAIRYFPAR